MKINCLKRHPKTMVMVFVFMFILISNTTSVFATLDDYIKLFDGDPTYTATNLKMQIAQTVTDSSSLLTTIGTPQTPPASQNQLLSYFKFNFQSSFNITSDKNKKWHWDHIKDFANTEKNPVFVLRICDIDPNTGAIKEDSASCLFSPVPYGTSPREDDLKTDGTTLCTSTTALTKKCSIPDEDKPTTKIYHIRSAVQHDSNTGDDYLKDGTTQYAKMNVEFKVTKLSRLNTNGTLDTPIAKSDKFKVGDATKYQADIWYCGQDYGRDNLDFSSTSDNIHTFNNLCGGNKPYFRIAQSGVFAMPPSNAAAIAQTEASVAKVNTTDTPVSVLPPCGVLPGSGSLMGCIAQVVYYVIYWPISWFARMMGGLFDFFLMYSVSDTSYRAEFAVRGWQLVRDISNIFFIIILVWTGLSTVFSGKSNMKQVVPQLILNALLINFSLFGTRVIIDLSNIVARVFYNSMSVCKGECTKKADGTITNPALGPGESKALSEKIISSFNPQKMFSTGVLDQSKKTNTLDSVSRADTPNQTATYYIIVTLIAAFIIFGVAMMFWKVAFMFLGRVIGLYVAMIFAPFAVLSAGKMPLVAGIKELTWDNWLKELTSYAMLAPIFVFFLYIIYSFLDSDFLKINKTDVTSSFFETVIFIAVPMLIVYFMIDQGVKIAKNYAGKIGEAVQDGAMKVIGAGVGIASGGAAFLGRNAVGRGLSLVGKSGTKTTMGADGKEIVTNREQRWAAAANNNWISRMRNNSYNATQTGSWDARNLSMKVGGKDMKAGDTLFKGLGLKDTISSTLSIGADKALGKDGKPGGNVMINKARDEAKIKALENKIQMSHLSDEDAKAAGAAYKDKIIKKYADAHWEETVGNIDALKAEKLKTETAEKALAAVVAKNDTTPAGQLALVRAQAIEKQAKEDFNTAKLTMIKEIKDGTRDKEKAEALIEGGRVEETRLRKYGNIKDNKAFTNMMRAEYVENLDANSFWSGLAGSAMGKGMTALFGTLLPVMAPAIGAAMATAFASKLANDIVDSATGTDSRAKKAIIKKATAAPGTGNTLVDLEAQLQKHKEESLDAIEASLKIRYATYEEAVTAGKAEEGVLKRIAELEMDLEKHDKDISDAKKAGKRDDEIDARAAKAATDKRLASLRRIDQSLAQAQKNLDEKKDRETDKEERKKAASVPKTT